MVRHQELPQLYSVQDKIIIYVSHHTRQNKLSVTIGTLRTFPPFIRTSRETHEWVHSLCQRWLPVTCRCPIFGFNINRSGRLLQVAESYVRN